MCFIQTKNQLECPDVEVKKETNLEMELCVLVLDNMNLSVFVIHLLNESVSLSEVDLLCWKCKRVFCRLLD